MAHHVIHPGSLTPATLRRALSRVTAHAYAAYSLGTDDARRACARIGAQLPFALYSAATVGAMTYLLLLTCRACG